MNELIAVLSEAFPPEPMSDPAMFERSAAPMWGGYLDAEAFESHVMGRSWDMLDSKFLEFHHDALAYLGADAFAAVLPAYLVALIRGEALNMLPLFLLNSLRRRTDPAWHPDIFDARVARLSEPQRAAVVHVLEVLARSDRHSHYRDWLEEALDSYWRHVPPRNADRLAMCSSSP